MSAKDTNESWHMWMSHITYEWVIAHIIESCHLWMSHGIHRNEPFHIWMNHVTCVWLWLSVSAYSNSNRQHIWDMTHSYMTLQQTAIDYNELQHNATHCNTLQHTATHCNTLQHTETHWNTLDDTCEVAIVNSRVSKVASRTCSTYWEHVLRIENMFYVLRTRSMYW